MIYFMIYGQFEGQLLGPLVYRRTVNVDPLLAILFLGELAGPIGAVVAVPAAAAG